MNKTAVIVLAAGKGTRMNSEVPKPLTELNGQPIVQYLLDSIEESQVCDKPIIVVGNKAELVKKTLGPNYTYVFQSEQLGTGHAVKVCKSELEGSADTVIVLFADHPLVTTDTIKALVSLHENSGTVMSMATVTVPDFEDWRSPFYSYGRVLRNESGEFIGIVEKKDATDKELKIREVSPSFFCFNADWLFENIEALRNDNAQGEYYLGDLVEIASKQKLPVASMNIDPHVAMGINTREELEFAKRFITEAKKE